MKKITAFVICMAFIIGVFNIYVFAGEGADSDAAADFTVTWEDAVLRNDLTADVWLNTQDETWKLSYDTDFGHSELQGIYAGEDGQYDALLTDGGDMGPFAEAAFDSIRPELEAALAEYLESADIETDDSKAVFHVTFHYNQEDYPDEIVELKEGSRLVLCEDKAFQNYNQYHKGYWFDGWYVDLELTEEYEKEAKIDSDITLYAAWREAFAGIEQMDNSPLADGRIAVLGSSECAAQSAIGEYLAVRFGADLIKEAVAGTTMTNINEHSFVSRIENISPDEELDLFFCMMSTNDAMENLPLGEIAEGYDLDSFDVNTITGAMEYIIAYVKQTWDCPLLIIISNQNDQKEYPQMVDRAYELQEKWDIHLIDLWNNDSINEAYEEQGEAFTTDGIHPTEKGYREWWGPVIEKSVLEFLNAENN